MAATSATRLVTCSLMSAQALQAAGDALPLHGWGKQAEAAASVMGPLLVCTADAASTAGGCFRGPLL